MKTKKKILGIIGLGYVGLPLAVAFSQKRKVIGFDISDSRIKELKKGNDKTFEVSKAVLDKSKDNLILSSDPTDLDNVNLFIVTVPTPINKSLKPDLKPILNATKLISKRLKKGDIVIYESTVYPGLTEEICAPLLEKLSNLKYNKDFYCGYSPERINPGDKKHKLGDIVKVTSGSTPKVAEEIDKLYLEIIKAGTHKAESIKVAEAAKVIENTQRDLNIALINELSIIFNMMNIDTSAVLQAAATKWNFINFSPGLVGGHCIGIDPYYLTFKAKQLGYNPSVILSGRKVNESMPSKAADLFFRALKDKDLNIEKSNVLIIGASFKENCNDLRNSKVVDLYHSIKTKVKRADIYDPVVDQVEAKSIFGKELIKFPKLNFYHGVILVVPHSAVINKGSKFIKSFCKKKHVFFDLKSVFNQNISDLRL